MDKTYFDIAILVGKYLADDLTGEERQYLDRWLSLSPRNNEWFKCVTSESYKGMKGDAVRAVDIEKGWQTLQEKRTRKKNRSLLIRWCKYAALFVSPLLVALVVYQQLYSPWDESPLVETVSTGTRKALLLLADGSSVALESQQQQVLKEQDGTKIDLREEHITYENIAKDATRELIYNELIIPRGGEYSLTLSDGTLVYMNADSKLRFPVNFGEGKRVVELEGEAYFQVARNVEAPFIVKVSGMDVRVLGTEFNISAYAEDSVIHATLVHGSVQVSSVEGGKRIVLHPGEQAALNRADHAIRVSTVDVSYAIAWKEGRLRFQEKSLQEIMKIVARWYDVEVVYEDEEVKDYPFGCNFSRHATIDPILQVFMATGTIEASVQGRKIWIRKKR